ncbi:hypothetical protein E2C01_097202 [Portunus trituberculatus]|uniref:Uncharacterized protein n=1 Tax=Portunus trituberculatus TaxID=210409 RepID=A0A5B7K535_PORTR|nr:hypothetical protein [Portunus trituberculatus]
MDTSHLSFHAKTCVDRRTVAIKGIPVFADWFNNIVIYAMRSSEQKQDRKAGRGERLGDGEAGRGRQGGSDTRKSTNQLTKSNIRSAWFS